ncbi:hypothetical protein FGO68_gene5900 [Halteria grandinella]|uniref:Ribosomal protein L19 n=1 Tax=Halteria grandinella TaxID=5974 RepID=A0A8J8T016_HALGN|nr:hypothetical protein FGO68_gene5900 [Halteria grandinella]
MAFLRLQKRLAASVLKVGKKRVWIDPNETAEVALANSRKNIRKLKQEKIREKQLAEQREARRAKNTVRKEKRIAKKLEQLGGGAAAPKEEKPAAAPKKEAAAPAKKETKPAAPAKEEAAPAKKDAPKKK